MVVPWVQGVGIFERRLLLEKEVKGDTGDTEHLVYAPIIIHLGSLSAISLTTLTPLKTIHPRDASLRE